MAEFPDVLHSSLSIICWEPCKKFSHSMRPGKEKFGFLCHTGERENCGKWRI